MANDSGGDHHNPWNNRQKEQGPPNLDKLFGQLQKRIRLAMKRGPKLSPAGSGFGASFALIGSILLFGVIIIWALSGFYIVRPAEEAVVLRFGEYMLSQGPGLHWLPPLVEKVEKVDTQMIHQYTYRSEMLTRDESIIDVEISVQYRYADPKAFLFKVADPVASLEQATASALRQVIGHNNMDDILTKGRTLVKQAVKATLTKTLATYHTGIEITDVNLQSAVPPEQVRDAFDDAIRAQEDERRYKRQAEAYRKQILPAAEGKAQAVLAEAEAYDRNVRLQAQGSTARFLAVLPEYQRATRVTRERMYLSTIESVLKSNPLVLVDTKQANNLLYLPLDKWLQSTPAVMNSSGSIKPSIPAIDANTPVVDTAHSIPSGSQSNSESSYLSIADRDNYVGRFEP